MADVRRTEHVFVSLLSFHFESSHNNIMLARAMTLAVAVVVISYVLHMFMMSQSLNAFVSIAGMKAFAELNAKKKKKK